MKLNENEKKVFEALVANMEEESGGSFGFFSCINAKKLGLTKAQIAGYASALVQKGLVEVYTNDCEDIEATYRAQATLTDAGRKLAGLED